MISPPRLRPTGHRFRSRKIQIIRSGFQWRYSTYLLMAVVVSTIIGTGPVYYFLNQNYDIFISLAYKTSPEIVENLERERVWINGLLITTLIGIATMSLLFGLKITARIIRPLMVLENHIERLIKGRMDQPELRLREGDEFHELIQSYNYLYKSLKANTLSELEALINFKLDEKQRDTYLIWKQLLETKSKQLGLPTPEISNETFSSASADLDSRRVS